MIAPRSVVALSLSVSALAASGCSLKSRPAQRFSGLLTSSIAACPTTHGNLMVRNGEVVFSPAETTWNLSGHAKDNQIEAARSTPGVNHVEYVTKLQATMTDAGVDGTYTTPTCTYAVRLTPY